MGSVLSCDDSVSGSSGFRSCLYSLDGEFLVKLEQPSQGSTKKNANEIFLEDLDTSFSLEEDFNDSIVKELGISLCETLHVHEDPVPVGISNPTLNQGDICEQMKINHPSFDTDEPKVLSKFASIQCSELVQSNLLKSDVDGLLCTTVINDNNSKAQELVFAQSPQAITELIPALKGSRALYGKHLHIKISVKWAPDVYDPPATSSSHTVKGSRRHRHHYHAKSKKDCHSHKYSKAKPSRSTSMVTGRKYSTNRSSSSSLTDLQRLQALGCGRPILNSCGRSEIESLNLAIGNDDDGAIMYGRKLLHGVTCPGTTSSC